MTTQPNPAPHLIRNIMLLGGVLSVWPTCSIGQEFQLQNLDHGARNAVSTSFASNHQNQAKAVTDYAIATQGNGPSQGFLDSPEFAQETARQAAQNSKTERAADHGFIDKIKDLLPRFGDAKGQLKYGRHVVVSANGNEIIELIRKTTAASENERKELLLQLRAFAADSAPEAINFFGFILETGSFGAHQDIEKASRYYKLAASAGYQPAIYNLALIAAYGKDGRTNQQQGLSLLTQANELGAESSGRICGMASFLHFRNKQRQAALDFAKGCNSPLSHFANVTNNPTGLTLAKRVALLRDTLATGADDAYALIEQIAKTQSDDGFLFCKYTLVKRFRNQSSAEGLHDAALRCVEASPNIKTVSPPLRDQVVTGIAGFVPMEINQLKKMRATNRFHYDWPAPFLPFAQLEVDLFEPIVGKASK